MIFLSPPHRSHWRRSCLPQAAASLPDTAASLPNPTTWCISNTAADSAIPRPVSPRSTRWCSTPTISRLLLEILYLWEGKGGGSLYQQDGPSHYFFIPLDTLFGVSLFICTKHETLDTRLKVLATMLVVHTDVDVILAVWIARTSNSTVLSTQPDYGIYAIPHMLVFKLVMNVKLTCY